MNAELFYSVKPNLSDEHNAELLNFLTTRGYHLYRTFGEHIALCCRIENHNEGREEIQLSSNLHISMEDTLSDSIKISDASGILRSSLLSLNPTRSFTIIDQYIFPKNNDNDYIELFFDVFGKAFEKINHLTIFTNTKRNQKLEGKIGNKIKNEYHVHINTNYTDAFHDRVWIIDDEKGLFVGTSLNGIGKKYTLFGRLQEQDVKDIVNRCAELCTG